MKKIIQLPYHKLNSSKNSNINLTNLKTKNNNNENKILNKSFKSSLCNSLINNKSKTNQNNIFNKESNQNNILLSNNIKFQKKRITQFKKIVKNPTRLKKENKMLNERIYYPKVLINSNFIEQKKQNKIIKANSNSYSRTAVSTINDNTYTFNINYSKRNENNILRNLIENINLKEIEKVSKIDLLKNNVFLMKIYSIIYSLISKDYSIFDLEKNLEIKNQFKELSNNIEILNNNKNINCNIINPDLFGNTDCFHNENNNILQESNNRKLIYKTFFNFYEQILNDIIKLSNEISLNIKSSSIKNEDFLLSSFNSKINLSENYNNINIENSLSFFNSKIIKFDLNDEKNIFYGMDDSKEISSLDNDFYQQILKNSFKEKNNSRNENKNLSSSSSIIFNNNNDSSDSEIIENSSEIYNNDYNKLKDVKKQISVPLLKINKSENNNKYEFACFSEKISEYKYINPPNLKNDILLNKINENQNLNKEVKEDKCYLF